jgi:hypothetical protein
MNANLNKLLLLILLILSYSVTKAEFSNGINKVISEFTETETNKSSFLLAVDKFDQTNLEVEVFESEYDTVVNNLSSSFNYSFHYSGIMRGINIAEISFKLLRTNPLTNKSYKLDSINIKYRFNNSIPINNGYFNPFFGQILNQEHLEYLLIRNRDLKSSQIQESTDEWFNLNLEYFKFYTKKDGIARISHSEILEFNPQIVGRNSKNIIIYNRGKQIKSYSSSPVIQHNEYIYFVGSHAKGDTSYYNFYTDKEPYFLTFDEQNETETYSIINNNIVGSKLETVEIDNHYEIDKIYGNGVDVIETEQSLCENWYEAELRPPNSFGESEEFKTNFVLFPTNELEIIYNYASNIFYLPETIRNKTTVSVNTHFEDTLNTSGSQIIERQFSVNEDDLLNGGNTFGIKSFKVVEDSRNDAYNGVIGFDYLDVKGQVQPIAEKDYISFIYDGMKSNYTDVGGFSSDNVVVMDTVNKTIQFPETQIENKILVDTKNNYISLYNNKQLISDNRYGYYIVESLNNLDRIFYYENSSSFLDKLSTINKDNIALLINTENEFSSELKNSLSNYFDLDKIASANRQYFMLKLSEELIESNEDFESNDSFGINFYAARVKLEEGESSRKIVNSLNSIEEVKLTESKIERTNENEYDVFYVYHSSLSESLPNYIDFISNKEDKSILTLDVEKLYDTYGYGIESPHSIKNFLQIAYNNWVNFPEFLVLVGDATWDPKKIMDKSFVDQMVPAYGIPCSDNFYGVLEGNDQVPEMVIGRIPVNNNTELNSYLDKIKTYYNVPQSPWMKQVLQLSGGDDNQKESFAFTMHSLNELFNKSEICFDTTTIGKTINTTVSDDKANEIKQSINEGKIWVNFLGHGSPHVIDMSGWEAPNLNNNGKYGILNTLSCNTSAFAEPHTVNSIGEEYVNIADKGFVASIGGTSTTFVNTALSVSTSIYSTLLDGNRIERNLGRIYNSYKPRASKSSSTLNQFVLLGDPLLTVRIPDSPDLAIFKNNTRIESDNGSNVITELDNNVNLKSDIYNLGMRTNDSVRVIYIHTFNSISDSVIKIYDEICFNGILEYSFNIEGQVGEHSIEVMIDYDSTFNDFNYTNNYLKLLFSVFPQGIQPLDPQDNWNISSENPIIRFVDPTQTEKSFEFNIYDSNNNLIYNNLTSQITNNYIEINPEDLNVGEKYRLEYKSTELETGIQSSNQFIDFYCTRDIDSLVHFKTEFWNNELVLKNLKINDNDIIFDDIDYKVELSSARGSLDGTAERHAIINTTNKNTDEVFTYINRLQRGFNLVVIPSLISDTTYEVLHFDTWDSKFNDDDIYIDSRWIDRYLRDSLNKGDYLLLATADVPTRAPDKIDEEVSPDSVGSTTRIIEALNNLGAKSADSLNFDASYVLFTQVGYPETTIDRINKIDTIQLETEYTKFREKGSIYIPRIGNVRDLKSLNIQANLENITSTIKAINNNKDTLLTESGNIVDFDNEYDNINTELSMYLEIERDSVGANYNFENLNIDFIPVPEISINNTESKLKENTVERAITAEYEYVISNISPRTDAKNIDIALEISNNFNNENKNEILSYIPNNTSINKVWEIDTKNLAINNNLSIVLDYSSKINESFYFNNSVSGVLKIREDTTKPYLVAYYNNKVLNNNDQVTIQPEIVIELYDDSSLEVLKDDVIFARINRRVILENTTDLYKFEILNQGNLKARLTFIMSDSLDEGQNILEVIGEDATGNKADTLSLSLYVPDEYQLVDSFNYPNPFTEATSLKYNYYGKENESEIRISIYDALGKQILKTTSTASFGTNEFKWDGLNSDGSTTSNGVYFFQLELINNPSRIINGKMMKIN